MPRSPITSTWPRGPCAPMWGASSPSCRCVTGCRPSYSPTRRGLSDPASRVARVSRSGPSGAGVAGRGLGAIPPTVLVLLGIVSVQLGSAVAKHLFGAVGSFGTVALRLFFAAVVLILWWRPSLRLNRRTWTVVVGYGLTLGLMNL